MNAKAKPRGLGRGLNALFEDTESENVSSKGAEQGASVPARGGKMMVGVEQLVRNETQPRTHFKDDAIESLAESLKAHGMLQPIVVRKKGDQFEIIAGERRWRAAQRAQMHEVPVSLVDMDDKEVLEVALIENLQREDLNPVEEALGYQRLANEYKMTQEEISKAIGKSRSHIANTVRLLNLPPQVLHYLETGELSAGHARALVTAPNAEELAREIVEKGLNVRAAEGLVASKPSGKKNGKIHGEKSADVLTLQNDLSIGLGMKVIIDPKDQTSGTVKIEFKSLDQFDELVSRLSNLKRVMLGE